MMYTVQRVGDWKCSALLSELFRNEIWVFAFLLILSYNVVGVTTWYGMDSLWIESQWGRDFPHPSRPALSHNQRPIRMVLCLPQW